MNSDKRPLDKPASQQARADGLKVREVLQYMSALASLHANPRTGNLLLSEALRDFTNALEPYAGIRASELGSVLQESKERNRISRGKEKPKISLPSQLEELPHECVEEILHDERYTKSQLMELGTHRFGISHSRLVRLNRKDVLATISAAVDHERSLRVISQEARRDAAKRTS